MTYVRKMGWVGGGSNHTSQIMERQVGKIEKSFDLLALISRIEILITRSLLRQLVKYI